MTGREGGSTLWDSLKHARNAKETPGIRDWLWPARKISRVKTQLQGRARRWESWVGNSAWGLTERGKLIIRKPKTNSLPKVGSQWPTIRDQPSLPSLGAGLRGGAEDPSPPPTAPLRASSVRLRRVRPDSIWLLGVRQQRRSLPGMLRGSDGPTSIPFPTLPSPPTIPPRPPLSLN